MWERLSSIISLLVLFFRDDLQSREHCWNTASLCQDDSVAVDGDGGGQSQQQQTMTTSTSTSTAAATTLEAVTLKQSRRRVGRGGSTIQSKAQTALPLLCNGCLRWRSGDALGSASGAAGIGVTSSSSYCSPPDSPSSSPGAAAVAAGTAACSSYQSYSSDDLYTDEATVSDPSSSRQSTEKDRIASHSHPSSGNKVTP